MRSSRRLSRVEKATKLCKFFCPVLDRMMMWNAFNRIFYENFANLIGPIKKFDNWICQGPLNRGKFTNQSQTVHFSDNFYSPGVKIDFFFFQSQRWTRNNSDGSEERGSDECICANEWCVLVLPSFNGFFFFRRNSLVRAAFQRLWRHQALEIAGNNKFSDFPPTGKHFPSRKSMEHQSSVSHSLRWNFFIVFFFLCSGEILFISVSRPDQSLFGSLLVRLGLITHLSSDLVSALTSLDMDDFTHFVGF